MVAFRATRMAARDARPVRPAHPYILKSVYVRKATPERLSVEIEPTYFGGKGVDPQKILQAQEFGGARRDKRSEAALRRIGILPSGYQDGDPGNTLPGQR